MDLRNQQILIIIVEDYIKSAQPVGSTYLVSKYQLDISSATVRNIMADLESLGLLTSPHTSAGRIPTEIAYRQFLELGVKNKELGHKKNLIKKDNEELKRVYNIKNTEPRQKVKNLAKTLAKMSHGAVLIGFDRNDVYYTGLSYLFAQPEFKNLDLVYNISEVVDHLDEVVDEIYDELPDKVIVKIGSDNPFGEDCSFVGTKINIDQQDQFIGLLGPMRMEYNDNVARLEYVKELLSR